MSILIVDDDHGVRIFLEQVLKDAGFNTLRAVGSAHDAYEQLGLNDPTVIATGIELILMDINMPGIDGIEACRQIKAKPRLRDIPVIMVTSLTDTATLQAAYAAGAADFMSPSTQVPEMLARINTALESKRDMDQRKIAYINEVEAKNRELENTFIQLEVKNQELEEALLAKTQILSTATHELRTPLTSIIGYVERVYSSQNKVGPLNERQEKYLGTALRNARRLKALVDDILDISRIEGWKLEISPVELDLHGEIEDVVNSLRNQITASGIHLSTNLTGAPTRIWGDRLRFSQVMGNLISNACKYSPEGAAVAVTAKSDGRQVQIDVSDTGFGISKENQAHLFTKFFRADNTNTREAYGTGLGLFITKNLIEAHGGTIWVNSEEGQGSTFSFTWPANALVQTDRMPEAG